MRERKKKSNPLPSRMISITNLLSRPALLFSASPIPICRAPRRLVASAYFRALLSDRAPGASNGSERKKKVAPASSSPSHRFRPRPASRPPRATSMAPGDRQPPLASAASEAFVETDPGIGEFTYRWPRPGLTADVVLVAAPGVAPPAPAAAGSSSAASPSPSAPPSSAPPSSAPPPSSRSSLLLIERKRPPGQGRWALAGGFVNEGEPLGEAAARELREETGVEVVAAAGGQGEEEEAGAEGGSAPPPPPTPIRIDQLRAYGDPGRDPRGWTVTVAFAGVSRDDPGGENRRALSATAGGDDASDARWFPLCSLPAMAFDHKVIVRDALRKLAREEEGREGRDEELLRDMRAALRGGALRGDWDRAF